MSENNSNANANGSPSVIGVIASLFILCFLFSWVAQAFLGDNDNADADNATIASLTPANAEIIKADYRKELVDIGFTNAEEDELSSSAAPTWRGQYNGEEILVVRSCPGDGGIVRWIYNPRLKEDSETARQFCIENGVDFIGWCSDCIGITSFVVRADGVVPSGWSFSASNAENTFLMFRNGSEWGPLAESIEQEPGYAVFSIE